MRRREVFSVKIKGDLKREFTESVREKGLSTCFVIEALLRAWLEAGKVSVAIKVDPSNTIRPIVINQRFERVVKRGARRNFKREFQAEDNKYLQSVNCWTYEEIEEGMANPNGHAVGCECSECRSL